MKYLSMDMPKAPRDTEGQRDQEGREQSREEYKLSSGAAGSQHLSAQHRSDLSLIFIPKHLQRASVAIIPETLLLAFCHHKRLEDMPAGDPESGADIHQRAGLLPCLFPGTEAFVPRDIFRQVVSLGHAGPLRSMYKIGVRVPYLYSTVPGLALSSSKIVSRAEASVHPALLLLLIRVAAAVY